MLEEEFLQRMINAMDEKFEKNNQQLLALIRKEIDEKFEKNNQQLLTLIRTEIDEKFEKNNQQLLTLIRSEMDEKFEKNNQQLLTLIRTEMDEKLDKNTYEIAEELRDITNTLNDKINSNYQEILDILGIDSINLRKEIEILKADNQAQKEQIYALSLSSAYFESKLIYLQEKQKVNA